LSKQDTHSALRTRHGVDIRHSSFVFRQIDTSHRPPATSNLVVIGAGPAGVAAAQAAQDMGAAVLLVDLADGPGGALVAMGLVEGGNSDEPPATHHQPIDALFQTALVGVGAVDGDRGLLLTLQGPGGRHQVTAGALVLATGGREPTRGNLLVPGTRPTGVLSAGAVLRLLHITGRLPGQRAVISGGGRWAAQCAEQLTAAGIEVAARTSGIAAIEGWPRVSAVTISGGQQVDCDLLVLAEEVLPWLTFPPGPHIFYAGSAALGPCDAETAAAHGAEVGVRAVSGGGLDDGR
jgi:NADPH-dependent 2,4-dienoyl-CoA reductase/sulfur reductase-like enzyme